MDHTCTAEDKLKYDSFMLGFQNACIWWEIGSSYNPSNYSSESACPSPEPNQFRRFGVSNPGLVFTGYNVQCRRVFPYQSHIRLNLRNPVKMDLSFPYSCLSASIGLRFAACHAGYTPQRIQMTIPKPTPSATDNMLDTVKRY